MVQRKLDFLTYSSTQKDGQIKSTRKIKVLQRPNPVTFDMLDKTMIMLETSKKKGWDLRVIP